MSRQKRYISTPIYYVNDRPHIGHVYTTTICDVWARAMRFLGHDVFFLTGTDEHGVKVEKSATERGIDPQALADENAAEFQRVLGRFALTNDDFIRTTDDHHERQVQGFVKRLLEKDAVYLGEFEGWYDEGQGGVLHRDQGQGARVHIAHFRPAARPRQGAELLLSPERLPGADGDPLHRERRLRPSRGPPQRNARPPARGAAGRADEPHELHLGHPHAG
jgi:hypothetical protein